MPQPMLLYQSSLYVYISSKGIYCGDLTAYPINYIALNTYYFIIHIYTFVLIESMSPKYFQNFLKTSLYACTSCEKCYFKWMHHIGALKFFKCFQRFARSGISKNSL